MKLQSRKAYPDLCIELLSTLESSLPAHLTYHNVAHTIDVANMCNRYIKYYKIKEKEATLLRYAAIGHDFGYIISPTDHEERSIKVLTNLLTTILTKPELEMVSGMIRATKVPQSPKTFLEEIIADADLDYLGREDYDTLSDALYEEFKYYSVVSTREAWLDLQISFLENHSYHTSFAQKFRKPLKIQKLKELKEKRKK